MPAHGRMVMSSGFDRRSLRDGFGSYITGVTIVTTLDAEGRPCGVTANSFSSVSLEPPLVLWSQALNARSFPAFSRHGRFVVNILALDQIELSQRFAVAGAEKFAGVSFRPGIEGLPVLEDCCAHFECRKVTTYPGGDHAMFLGLVERFEHKPSSYGLAFGNGRYLATRAHRMPSVVRT